MIVALDTDVLVNWAVTGARHHVPIRSWVDAALDSGTKLGLTQQVCFEFLQVVTDPKRFEKPLQMPRAVGFVRQLWTSREIERVGGREDVIPRLCTLLHQHQLGRKRILDTALAATLHAAGIDRLATLNGRHYKAFSFLEIVDPRSKTG